jgi:hypothetical protein
MDLKSVWTDEDEREAKAWLDAASAALIPTGDAVADAAAWRTFAELRITRLEESNRRLWAYIAEGERIEELEAEIAETEKEKPE